MSTRCRARRGTSPRVARPPTITTASRTANTRSSRSSKRRIASQVFRAEVAMTQRQHYSADRALNAAARAQDDPRYADLDEEGDRRSILARDEAAEDLLDTIVAEHEQLARLLQTLPDPEWSRQGRHPSLGVMSIEFLARRVGEHAEEHAAQIV